MVRSPQSKLARLAERHGDRVRVIGTGDGEEYAESPLWVEAGVFHLAESLLFETCEQLIALDSEVAVVRVGSDRATLYVRGELDCSEIMPAPTVDASTLEEDDSEVSFDGIDAPSLVDDVDEALADGDPPPVVQLVAQPAPVPVPVAQAGPVLISPDGATGPRCRIGALWEAPLPSSRVDRLAWAGARDTVESIQVQTAQVLRAYHVDQFGAQGGVLHLFPEREPTRAEQAVATLTLRLDAEGALVGTRLTPRRAHVPARPIAPQPPAKRSDSGFILVVLLALLVAAVGIWQGTDWTANSGSSTGDVVASAMLAQPALPGGSTLQITDLEGGVLDDPVLTEVIPALSRCHEHAVKGGEVPPSELEGALRVRYVVTASGGIEQVSLVGRTLVSQVADSCFETVLLTMRYPEGTEPGDRSARLSFTVPSG